MKSSLAALAAACAVYSAAFGATMLDNPPLTPPHVAMRDNPPLTPPHVAALDNPPLTPPHNA